MGPNTFFVQFFPMLFNNGTWQHHRCFSKFELNSVQNPFLNFVIGADKENDLVVFQQQFTLLEVFGNRFFAGDHCGGVVVVKRLAVEVDALILCHNQPFN
jgi:hypothetical protein